MKKNLAKIIALLMALVLVFSFAACGGNDEEPSTDPSNDVSNSEDANTPEDPDAPVDPDAPSEDASNEDPSADPSNPDAPADPANPDKPADPAKPDSPKDPAKPDSPKDPTKPSTPANSGIAKPANAAEGVKLYNDALGKSSWKKTYVDRKLTKADTSAGNLDDITGGLASKKFAEGSGNVSTKLSKLNASDVKSYSVADGGKTWDMTFNLNNVTGGAELTHGKGGYMYFLTMDEINSVVVEIGNAVKEGFKIEINKSKSSITLNSGKLVVKVDKNTGKITAATLNFTEDIKGVCKALGFLNVNATLQGKGTVTFTYA